MTVDESNGFFAVRRFDHIAAICVEIIDDGGAHEPFVFNDEDDGQAN